MQYTFVNTQLINNASSESKHRFLETLTRIYNQLSPTHDVSLGAVYDSCINGNYLIIAYEDRIKHPFDAVVGTASLSITQTPRGKKGSIEDVVVDKKYRRQGIGKTMITRLIRKTQELGASSLYLTSNEKRTAANAMYIELGFEHYTTNHYKYPFPDYSTEA